MTNRRGQSRVSGAGAAAANRPPGKWVEIALTEADKEALRNTDFDLERFIDWLGMVVMENYKFSLSRKRDGDEVCASLYATAGVKDVQSREYTLTAWGSNPEKAMHCLIYKWYAYCTEGFPIGQTPRQANDFA